ncbi:MAG: hypothetical protein C4527_09235 [Candidatus Omnitrophota bacterium]|jgi:hypothetical protein|nr:MAG: hypothetical protein C4527_09235 [Candidatus Omnitrophota bacterium]
MIFKGRARIPINRKNFIADGLLPQFNVEIGDLITEFQGGGTGNHRNLDVTPSLQKWSQNPSQNLGWIFEILGNDGVVFYAKECGVDAGPPSLVVTYEDITGISGFSHF